MKVMSVTSLVMIMLLKKQSSTIVTESFRRVRARARRDSPSRRKTPRERHDGHEAEEQRQRAEIRIGQIVRIGRNSRGGKKRQYGGYAEHGLLPEELPQRGKGLMQGTASFQR